MPETVDWTVLTLNVLMCIELKVPQTTNEKRQKKQQKRKKQKLDIYNQNANKILSTKTPKLIPTTTTTTTHYL